MKTRYQIYVDFCNRLGIKPMDEVRWSAGAFSDYSYQSAAEMAKLKDKRMQERRQRGR